jgi:hypothetical protein
MKLFLLLLLSLLSLGHAAVPTIRGVRLVASPHLSCTLTASEHHRAQCAKARFVQNMVLEPSSAAAKLSGA